ncbi:MAG: hypothetical protein GX610_23860 [Rhodococcus sp.]|nr:hypothetical protein [Rhodococcus sp. (in: high G+C Gram-positive bacteria)]
MGIEIPGSLRWVADNVLGTDWPDADETAMQRCADYWDNASTAIDTIDGLGDDAVRQLLDSIDGDVNEAIAGFWQKIGGDAGAMRELMQTCDELADMLDGAAQDVRRAKLAIIANLVALAASLVAAAATVWAFGAGAAAGAAATMATRASIQMIIRQLITQMLKRIAEKGARQFAWEIAKNIATTAAIGAGKAGGIEAGLQTYERTHGLRDDYDYGDVAQATGNGAVKGAVQAGIKIAARGGEVRENPSVFSKDAYTPEGIQSRVDDMKSREHVIGGMIGTGVANLTVGKPDEGIGSLVRDAIEESGMSLNLPADTFTSPSDVEAFDDGQ